MSRSAAIAEIATECRQLYARLQKVHRRAAALVDSGDFGQNAHNKALGTAERFLCTARYGLEHAGKNLNEAVKQAKQDEKP